MKENPPPRDEAIRLMAEHPNLLRRPLLQVDDQFVFGYNEDEYRRLVSGGGR
jgi:arsenate reductase-like glutaredoxin family protein